MRVLITLIAVFSLFTASLAMLAGGWKDAGLSDERIINAAIFAVQEAYGVSGAKSWALTDAKQQVVAGMNYELTIIVHPVSSDSCKEHVFRVYDRFGSRTLTSNEDMGVVSCK